MNLYALHNDPRSLLGGNAVQNFDSVPIIVDISQDPANLDGTELAEIMEDIRRLGKKSRIDIEQALLKIGQNAGWIMYIYAMEILYKRWPDAEKFIAQDEWAKDPYEELFGIK